MIIGISAFTKTKEIKKEIVDEQNKRGILDSLQIKE